MIVSTDRDLMQLVSARVVLLDTMRDRRYGPAEVEERFGVPPKKSSTCARSSATRPTTSPA